MQTRKVLRFWKNKNSVKWKTGGQLGNNPVLGGELGSWMERSSAEKKQGVLVDRVQSMSQQCVLRAEDRQHPGMY